MVDPTTVARKRKMSLEGTGRRSLQSENDSVADQQKQQELYKKQKQHLEAAWKQNLLADLWSADRMHEAFEPTEHQWHNACHPFRWVSLIFRGLLNLNACRILPKPLELQDEHWRGKIFHQQLYETYNNDLMSTFIRSDGAHYMFVVEKTSASRDQKAYQSDCFETWLKLLQACNNEALCFCPLGSAKDATLGSLCDYRQFVSYFAHFSHVHYSA